MSRGEQHNPRPAPVARRGRREQKEPLLEQLSSFIGFFVYLLVLKSFFLPLFVIPTGSMAETLYGMQAQHTCPNCGVEYPVGLTQNGGLRVPIIQCPNCRWREHLGSPRERAALEARGLGIDGSLRVKPRARGGDRIMVHGWPYELGGAFKPQRWDVVVFKVPKDGQTNYIKRLIGKPGETVEIIDGDIFITDAETGQTDIARKTPHAQHSLWLPYYDHDYPPHKPSHGANYHPRWVPVEGQAGWSNVRTRRPRFDGHGGLSGELRFVTAPGQAQTPGTIQDVYGYNSGFDPRRDQATNRLFLAERRHHQVTDVRLSCEVTIEAIAADGFVELSASKYADRFFARLYADGRLTLEHQSQDRPQRETWAVATPWGTGRVPLQRPVRLALSSVDYVVSIEIDDRPVEALRSTPAQYNITPQRARTLAADQTSPVLAVAASNVRASFAHLLIERDVFYTTDPTQGDRAQQRMYGTPENPIALRPGECFVLGDNSPSSLDGRFSFAQVGEDPVGPHLGDEYRPGTVPTDQVIGPAFLVYWPGMGALIPDQPLPRWLRLINQLPNPGRIRWIH